MLICCLPELNPDKRVQVTLAHEWLESLTCGTNPIYNTRLSSHQSIPKIDFAPKPKSTIALDLHILYLHNPRLFTVTDFIFSLLKTTTSTSGTASLIDATTRRFIPYSDVPLLVRNIAVSLRQPPLSLTNGACAFVIAPNSSYLPILYLSLFSLGVVISPLNPASSTQEISRQLRLCKQVVAFATVESANKLLEVGFPNPVVSDTSAILYSPGTMGKIKGVKLTHRNLISTNAGASFGRHPQLDLRRFPSFGKTLCGISKKYYSIDDVGV
ncbi:hypothetical protein LXL04_013744 [Taraxacum kok-saghyz]